MANGEKKRKLISLEMESKRSPQSKADGLVQRVKKCKREVKG